MLDLILGLVKNPFSLIFIFFILTLIAFFLFEIFSEHKRMHKHYSVKKILAGCSLIIFSLVVLFVPFAGKMVNSVYELNLPGSAIGAYNNCEESMETETSHPCLAISFVIYTLYILIFIGVAMIIAGFITLS